MKCEDVRKGGCQWRGGGREEGGGREMCERVRQHKV